MAQIINTNVSTLTAQRNAGRVQGDLTTAINRLSSGLRINSAKDDAAGMAISERMTTQIRGMNQAARNANDAISLSQTAEGGLGSAANSLQRIRELAVQASNATNSASDRAALQAEVAAQVAEIQRIGDQTEFNGTRLLDGTFTKQTFQVGPNSGQIIELANLADVRASSLGRHELTLKGSVTGTVVAPGPDNGIPIEDDLMLDLGQGLSAGPISYPANASAKEIADAINTAGASIGVHAKSTNETTLKALTSPGSISFQLNGQTIAAEVTDRNDLSSLVSAINGFSQTTGVTATFTGTSRNNITLTTSDGRNISIDAFTNADDTSATVDFGTATLADGGSAVKTGTVELTSARGPITTAGADAAVFAAAGVNRSLFYSVAAVDVSSFQGAQDALLVIDAALAQVNGGRADLGAIQNRFEATISNVEINSENLSASRSRILDADFAKETAALSRAQVLQQAANAMVAQANQMPQQVLQLLQR